MQTTIIATKTHRTFMDDSGIIHVEVVEGAHLDVRAMTELRNAMLQLSGGRKEVVMVDARPHHTITDEGMSYLKKQMIDKDRVASAIVTDKLGVILMVDYFNKVLGTKAALKVCTSKDEAINWLKGYLPK